MKSKDAVGKRIVEIKQKRIHRDDGGEYVGYGVSSIVLEDGTTLSPLVLETGYGYAIDILVGKLCQEEN